MSTLFDAMQQPQTSEVAAGATPAVVVSPPRRPARFLGTMDGEVSCVDETCQSTCHDVTGESRGFVRIECFCCGTGQWVRKTQATHALDDEGVEFVFHGGRFDGHTIEEASKSPRGLDYIAWASKEHPRPAVKDACKKWLAARGQVC